MEVRFSIQVYPPIPSNQLSEMFVKGTKFSMPFLALVGEAIKVKKWITQGLIEDRLQEMKEHIMTGTNKKKGKEKKKEDFDLILLTTKKNFGTLGIRTKVARNTQINAVYQGQ